MTEKEIELYTTKDGKCPFIEWIQNLSYDFKIRIYKRINRMKDGNYGNWKKLQNSQLSELKLDFGKGYRVYFKELDNVIENDDLNSYTLDKVEKKIK